MLLSNLSSLKEKLDSKLHATSSVSDSTDHYYLGLSPEGFHRLYYRQWGSADAEETILCVHGLTRISHDFDILAKALGKHYRVICPDVVGRGNSDWFGNKDNYNIAQYCADINALIAHLNVDSVHYIGTSMGGIMGIIMAAMANTPIKSLILNDVGPDIKRSELQTMGQYVGNAPVFENKHALYEYYREIYSGSCAYLSHSEIKQLAKYSSFKTNGGYQLHYDPKIGEAFRKNYSAFNFDLWKYWDEIDVPLLIVRGSESTFLTKEVAEKMRGSADLTAELIEVPGAGHTPMLRTENEIETIQRFYETLLGQS